MAYTDPIKIRLPQPILQRVDAEAKRTGETRSAIIRRHLLAHLDEIEAEADATRHSSAESGHS